MTASPNAAMDPPQIPQPRSAAQALWALAVAVERLTEAIVGAHR